MSGCWVGAVGACSNICHKVPAPDISNPSIFDHLDAVTTFTLEISELEHVFYNIRMNTSFVYRKVNLWKSYFANPEPALRYASGLAEAGNAALDLSRKLEELVEAIPRDFYSWDFNNVIDDMTRATRGVPIFAVDEFLSRLPGLSHMAVSSIIIAKWALEVYKLNETISHSAGVGDELLKSVYDVDSYSQLLTFVLMKEKEQRAERCADSDAHPDAIKDPAAICGADFDDLHEIADQTQAHVSKVTVRVRAMVERYNLLVAEVRKSLNELLAYVNPDQAWCREVVPLEEAAIQIQGLRAAYVAQRETYLTIRINQYKARMYRQELDRKEQERKSAEWKAQWLRPGQQG
ncbi:hypothetical protein LTR85_001094 [Meristemomyces frigidus]|nr:hypothetical protein LTR85_001094 [Meristemomyces frigidus]